MKLVSHILTLEVGAETAEMLVARIEEQWQLSVVQLERPGHPRVWLEMYFQDSTEAAIARAAMSGWPGVVAAEIRREGARDWQTFWRHHFHATDIGRHLRIVPVWEKEQTPDAPDRKTIWLDPGLSFGTGDHFTTRFCLEMIDHWAAGGTIATMLDVGTGSGILAIAAVLLGVPHAVGMDHDAMALEQARENLRMNQVTGRVEWQVADIMQHPPQGAFDLVCANVYTTVLIAIAPALAHCARRHLVLSGIRDPELDRVATVYGGLGLTEVFRDGDGEWGGLAFEKLQEEGS